MPANESCSPSAVELRRRIGTKEISPVELLEACIERIEHLTRRSTPSPRPATTARAGSEGRGTSGVARRRARPAARPAAGIKDLEETGGLLTTYGSPLYRDFVPERDNAMVARVRAAGAIVVGKTNVPEFGAGANSRNLVWGATGNPFDPDAQCRRLLRRLGRRARVRHAAGVHGLGHRRVAAHSRGQMRRRRLPALARSRPVERRPLGWTPISVVGPMGRTVADTCLLMAAQAALDDCDPLSYPVTARVCRARAARPRARCALPTPKISASARSTRRSAPYSATTSPRCDISSGPATKCVRSRRSGPLLRRDPRQDYVGALSRRLREGSRLARPQRARQLRDRREMTLADMALGARRADAHLPALPADVPRLRPRAGAHHARVAVSVVPALFAEMDGKPLGNYYHWLSLTYVITL